MKEMIPNIFQQTECLFQEGSTKYCSEQSRDAGWMDLKSNPGWAGLRQCNPWAEDFTFELWSPYTRNGNNTLQGGSKG